MRRNPHECAVAKTHYNSSVIVRESRNPHECAVAKIIVQKNVFALMSRNPHECAVAKPQCAWVSNAFQVATRTNALWQRRLPLWSTSLRSSQPARMRCGKAKYVNASLIICRRNPHECAVAKTECLV